MNPTKETSPVRVRITHAHIFATMTSPPYDNGNDCHSATAQSLHPTTTISTLVSTTAGLTSSRIYPDDDSRMAAATTERRRPRRRMRLRTTTDDGILRLRDVFLAIDFDSALWDALFASSCSVAMPRNQPQASAIPWTATAAAAAAVPPRTVRRPTTGTTIWRGSHGTKSNTTTTTISTKSSYLMSSNQGRHRRSMSTLASVLTFLHIDHSTIAIPPEYLVMTPACDGLEHFRIHHPHLHDCLLQTITMAVLRSSMDLHSQHVAETATSLGDHITMINHAIRNLTDINRKQLPLL